MTEEKKYTIELNKEEIDVLLEQFGGKPDYFSLEYKNKQGVRKEVLSKIALLSARVAMDEAIERAREVKGA